MTATKEDCVANGDTMKGDSVGNSDTVKGDNSAIGDTVKGDSLANGDTVKGDSLANGGTVKRDSLANGDTVKKVKQDIVWKNVIILTIVHFLGLYGWKVLLYDALSMTAVWNLVVGYFGGFGVTAGAHRLWTHRSYKAKWQLRIILAYAYLVSGMNSIFDWVRDHRVHHKFSETDADPHNSRRGFFFSHVGWLLQKKHPEVIRKGREVDMSDVLADPIVKFEERFFIPLQLASCFLIPIAVPCFFWGETLLNSSFCTFARWMASLHAVWSVNSFAHIFGNRPYNENIQPAENLFVSIFALGEGWHNYHHTFPWDYKTSELGIYGFNFTTAGIDFFAWVGWAYDLKQPSKKLVYKVMENLGDGTQSLAGTMHSGHKNVYEIEDKIKGF